MIALWITVDTIAWYCVSDPGSNFLLCIVSVRNKPQFADFRFESLNLFFPIDEQPKRRAVIFWQPTQQKDIINSNVSLDRNTQEWDLQSLQVMDMSYFTHVDT